jgi:hypothetical protein
MNERMDSALPEETVRTIIGKEHLRMAVTRVTILASANEEILQSCKEAPFKRPGIWTALLVARTIQYYGLIRYLHHFRVEFLPTGSFNQDILGRSCTFG